MRRTKHEITVWLQWWNSGDKAVERNSWNPNCQPIGTLSSERKIEKTAVNSNR